MNDKGRKLEIGFKKDEATPTDHKAAEKHFEHKVTIVGRVFEKTVTKVVIGVCAYVVLDTVRQVVVKGFVPE